MSSQEWKNQYQQLVAQVEATRARQRICDRPHMKSEWIAKKNAERKLDMMLHRANALLLKPDNQIEIFN